MTPTPLGALLAARLRRDGPMTFRDYMAEALYHPEHGYYATGRPWRGRGDFTTAPRYGDAFALAVARFAAMARDALGPGGFEVVEVGSGSGLLAAQLQPLLAESGMRLRAVERRRPPRLPAGVPWSASLRGLEVRGAIVSNELFDALPVHRVTREAGALREWWVAAGGGGLALETGPLSRPEVGAYLARFGLEPEEGQTVEAGLDALAMLREMAAALRHGFLLTIDYGHHAPALRAHGPHGTLAATRDHRVEPDPLARPGEVDLTAHVNLTALVEEGRALGLAPVAELAQWELLASTGTLDHIAAGLQRAEGLEAALAAKTLAAPGRMGEFRVLVQAAGVAEDTAARLARRLRGPTR